jgi:hypothetical protein
MRPRKQHHLRRLQIDKRRLRKLQKEFNARLEREGLGEIEETDAAGEQRLKQYAVNAYRGATALEVSAKLDFFLQCSSMCQQYRFKRKIDRLIMELYCEGKAKEEIRAALEDLGIKYDRRGIYAIIQRHLIIFGLNGK